MQAIHPEQFICKVTCSCGNKFVITTAKGTEMAVEMCHKCHSAYTGKRKIAQTGAIDKFAQKYATRMSGFVSAGHNANKSDKPAADQADA